MAEGAHTTRRPGAAAEPGRHAGDARRPRARYLAAVANADRDLGLVYDAARKHLGKDMLFVFTSDHGAQFPFGKWNCYDAGVRTPLVVAWPGRVSRDVHIGRDGELDRPAADLPGGGRREARRRRSAGGRSSPCSAARRPRHRDQVFVTHSGDGEMNRYPIRAVRTRDWKYIRNLDPAAEHHTHVDKAAAGDGRDTGTRGSTKARTDPAAAAVVRRYHTRPAEELYDLKADPWELKNLAADPAHADMLKALRADLDAWMEGAGRRGAEDRTIVARPAARSRRTTK